MTIPATHADLLERPTIAHIATLGPDGAPQSTPVWFRYDGETVKFSLTTGRQKYRNVTRNPAVALSILDPDNPYRYLEVRGVVSSIDADPDLAFINSLAQRYLGEEKYPWHQPSDQRVIVSITPQHSTAMG